MISKKDYLLEWGMDFVENFKFKDDRVKKKRNKTNEKIHDGNAGGKTHILDPPSNKLPDSEYEDKTAHEKNSIPSLVSQAVALPPSNKEIFQYKSFALTEKISPKKSFYPTSLNRVAIVKKKKTGYQRQVSDPGKISNKINKNKTSKDNVINQSNMNNAGSTNLRNEQRELRKTYNREKFLEDFVGNNKQVTKKIKQFPYLKEILEEANPRKKGDLLQEEIIGFQEPIRLKTDLPGGMGQYILLDPENDEHSKYGFIYLDEYTKVSNHHFYNFRPEKYQKPPAIREICLNAEKMKEINVKSDKKDNYEESSDDKNQESPKIRDYSEILDSTDLLRDIDFKMSNLHFKGSWNAELNIPKIEDGKGNHGDFYVVSIPGKTEIDGENQWEEGNIIFSDKIYESEIREETLDEINESLNVEIPSKDKWIKVDILDKMNLSKLK